MEKRMLLAIVLSLVVLLAFQVLLPQKQTVTRDKAPFVSSGDKAAQEVPHKTVSGAQEIKNYHETLGEEKLQEEETIIQTDKFQLVFSNIGASLKSLSQKEFQEKGTNLLLYSENLPEERIFAIASNLIPDMDKKIFSQEKGKDFLEYTLIDKNTVKITKRYNFSNSNDYITLAVSIANLSPYGIIFSDQLTGPSELKSSEHVAGQQFLELDAMIDGKVWKKKTIKGQEEKTGYISWVALKDRYFAIALKPFTPPKSILFQQTSTQKINTVLNSQIYEIAPGQEIKETFLLYAGPLDESRLSKGAQDLQLVVDYGFFGILSKGLLVVLKFFHSGIKNWGIAIILLTILMNIVLFPLTLKSFTSMQKMKKVQPHIQKLRELHKDNPQKLNKEMMELYKSYNINPLGGCLPLVLQMPIFIALYNALMRSVELKGAHFLWIKDLSKPDAVHIPFSLPILGNSINILPLLMIVAMFLQQKFTEAFSSAAMSVEQAKQQKMMMFFMPIVFGFIFYNMPSGLVLYWLMNTILMTAEQGIIHKQMQ